MDWKFEEAQKKLLELIDATANEPQLIFARNQLVAVMLEPNLFQEFLAWHQQQKTPSLTDAFTER